MDSPMKLLLMTGISPLFEAGAKMYVYQLLANFPGGDTHVVTNRCARQKNYDRLQNFRTWRSWLDGRNPGKLSQLATFLAWMIGLLLRHPFWRTDVIVAADIYLSALRPNISEKNSGCFFVLSFIPRCC
ncbi:MAG TPA: hypothetical protein DDZ40_00175 [Deltaproteobacteria bacterium]|nr:hypothetical protein [Deltaproteobacteria bacterium]